MLLPNVGTRVASIVATAVDAESAPKIAKRAKLATQAIYNYRDGRLPSRLAISSLARGLRVKVADLERAVASDREDRRSPRRQKAGAA